MKKIKINRTIRYLFSLGLLIIAFNAFLGIVLTTKSAKAIKSIINGRMLDISKTAAAMLDGDVLARLQAGDADTPEYQAALDILRYFQDNIELEYIYCVRKDGNRNFVFTIDPAPDDPGEFGQPVVYTDALYRASLGVSSVDEESYEDEWGRFYSAYSPVFDSAHEIAGIVAVDFSAEWYEDRIRSLRGITITIIVAAVILCAAVFFLISSRYSKNYSILEEHVYTLSKSVNTLLREVLPGVDDPGESDELEVVGYKTDDEIAMIGEKLRTLERRLEKKLSYVHAQAYVDGLTGLENRLAYADRITRMDEQIKAGNTSFSVAVFDINQLKIINDDFGHEEGDRIISAAARALQVVFRDESIFRIGGDEFVIICSKTSPEDACTDLKRAIEDINRKAGPPDLAISIGYSTFNKDTDSDYNSVFSRADAAMYADKREFYKTHEDRRKKSK